MRIDVRHNRIIHSVASASLGVYDTAECLDFARPVTLDAVPFDSREINALESAALSASTPLDRERALWELADRTGEKIKHIAHAFIRKETDRSLRISALWLLQRSAGDAAIGLLRGLFKDDDPEIADWARTLTEELTGEPSPTLYNRLTIHENRTFDQTLPLLISGYMLLNVPALGRVKVVIPPLWFESIMGRVMACTNAETVLEDLVIEKKLSGLHPDGSDHFEVFKFKGMSTRLSDQVFEHHYESLTERRFYPSGRVESGNSVPVPVSLWRCASTEFASTKQFEILGDGGPRANRLASQMFVRTVRGRFLGWAAVNLQSYLATGIIAAGDVQLSNPTDPIAGPATNGRLFGTFRGKISDYSGGHSLELNTIQCHATVDGKHDLHCNGSEVADPFAS